MRGLEYKMLKNLRSRDVGRVQDGVGLFSSILLRYSEIESVHYRREQHALRFTFITKSIQDVSSVSEVLRPALEFFHKLEGRTMRIFEIDDRCEENVRMITVTRDIDSMTQREVGLIVELLKREFQKRLLFEEMNLPEDERIFQEELISHMLSSIQPCDIDKNVVALREESKVLVFKN
jgi:hypothetical protein